MLLANEIVARWFQGRDAPTIYRVHAPPDEQKLDRFARMCESLSIEFDIEDTRDPKKLGDLLKSFADHPLAPVLNSLLLRSMKQATYDVANIGHFGLASKAYLHFTSPIRRYPDLVVHRAVHQVLTEGEPRRDEGTRQKLAEAALASSIAERRAMEVERAVVDLYRTFLMKSRIGERFHGTVTAVVGSGLFVQLDSPFVDVLIRLEDLGHDHWEVDDDALRVVAARSGDVWRSATALLVEIIDAAILRRTVYAKRVGGEAGDGAGMARTRRRVRAGARAPPARRRRQGPTRARGRRPGPPGRGAASQSRSTSPRRKDAAAPAPQAARGRLRARAAGKGKGGGKGKSRGRRRQGRKGGATPVARRRSLAGPRAGFRGTSVAACTCSSPAGPATSALSSCRCSSSRATA